MRHFQVGGHTIRMLLVFALMFGLPGLILADFSRSMPCEKDSHAQMVQNDSVQPQVMLLLGQDQDFLYTGPDPIIREAFDDDDFADRGWFDGNFGVVDPAGREGVSGGNCLKWEWQKGDAYPGGSIQVVRKNFQPTEEIFLRVYANFSEEWEGSGFPFHPHTFVLYPDDHLEEDGNHPGGLGLLTTYLSFRSELSSPFEIRPHFALQDGRRVNTAHGNPPVDLAAITEDRSVNYCNGCVEGQDCGTGQDCFPFGDGYYSARYWTAENFEIPKNQWVKLEWYIRLSSVDEVGKPDGIMQMWVDNDLAYESTSMLYRTGQNSTQAYAQLKVSPYIGSTGSPKNQTMWIDELAVYDYNVKESLAE